LPARSSSKKVVKYTGMSDVRVVEKNDWKAIGIDDQDTVVWDWRNDWAVPVGDLSEGALNYAKNVDDELKIIDAEGS
jgi:predicted sulfurtransferase